MVGSEGVEPSTKRLRVSCSTTELQTHLFFSEGEYAQDLETGKLNMHLEMPGVKNQKVTALTSQHLAASYRNIFTGFVIGESCTSCKQDQRVPGK